MTFNGDDDVTKVTEHDLMEDTSVALASASAAVSSVPMHIDVGSVDSALSSFESNAPRTHEPSGTTLLPGRLTAAAKRSQLRAWNPSYSWQQQREEQLILTQQQQQQGFHFHTATDAVIDASMDAAIDAAELGKNSAKSYHSSASETILQLSEEDDKSHDKSHPKHTHDIHENTPQEETTSEKTNSYSCKVDYNQGDRSVEINLGSMARPHMRAFHLAWIAFFVAFFTWFAITPLLSDVQFSLRLTKRQIWTSSIYGVAGSAVTRVLVGPFCDKYGARWTMCIVLLFSAIPTALTGLVQTGMQLNMLRLLIGVSGSSFVACQYWTSSMFTKEVAGTANALVAGWGNLGGGVTQIVMGSLLFPLFKAIANSALSDDENNITKATELAWRTVCVVPAILCLMVAYFLVKHSDDSPKGNYVALHQQGIMTSESTPRALARACWNTNVWILFLQYGCCFGVEITMVNAAALYFKHEFALSTESAAAIASIFGWMNLFARGVGGFCSDMANAKFGMRGRFWVQAILLFLEGVLAVIFSKTDTLGGAIVTMAIFSIFVQAAAGSTFGIVTYVDFNATGSIEGFVGAGGNVGGVVFAFLFREYNYRPSIEYMGFFAMGSAVLTVFLSIRGHASLLHGHDALEIIEWRMQRNGTSPQVNDVHEDRLSPIAEATVP